VSLDVALDHRERHVARCGVEHLPPEHARPAEHGVQRRARIFSDDGEEPVLRATRRFGHRGASSFALEELRFVENDAIEGRRLPRHRRRRPEHGVRIGVESGSDRPEHAAAGTAEMDLEIRRRCLSDRVEDASHQRRLGLADAQEERLRSSVTELDAERCAGGRVGVEDRSVELSREEHLTGVIEERSSPFARCIRRAGCLRGLAAGARLR
jgi:hypothetical protein